VVRSAAGAARRKAGVDGPEDRPYSWLEDYLATLEGKEAREEYYAWLEYELEWMRGRPLVPPEGTAPVKKRSAG
jgi:hypothetical protein